MRRLSLRLRIISALVLLAAGTSAAVSGLTTYFLSRTPQVSTNPELGRALQNALDLAKRDYGARKARLLTLGDRWAEDSRIISAYENNDIAEVNDLILQRVPGLVARFAPSTAALTRRKPAVGRTDGDHTKNFSE